MATSFISILADSPPANTGSDDNGRMVFSMNFSTTSAHVSDTLEENVAELISNAGLGTLGSDMFIGLSAVFPPAAGPFIRIVKTGGAAPLETHDGSTYDRIRIQILIHDTDYTTGRTKANAIYSFLNSQHDIVVP